MSKGYELTSQKISICVDFDGSIEGVTDISFTPTRRDLKTLWLNASNCTIHSVKLRPVVAPAAEHHDSSGAGTSEGLDLSQDTELDFVHVGVDHPVLKKDNVRSFPELKRALWQAQLESDEAELGIAIPQDAILEDVSAETPLPVEDDKKKKKDSSESHVAFQILTIVISYTTHAPKEHGIPSLGSQGGIVSIVPDHLASFRYPQVFTVKGERMARSWVPCDDTLWNRCPWDLEFIVPKNLSLQDDEAEVTVAASGELVERRSLNDDFVLWHYSIPTPVSAQQVAWAMAPFKIHQIRQEKVFEAIPLTPLQYAERNQEISNESRIFVMSLPRHEDEVVFTGPALGRILAHYSQTYGSYPFSVYTQAFVDSLQLGMSSLCSAGFSISGSDLLHPKSEIDQAFVTRQELAHNIAVQWSGVNIIPRSPADLWLTVGIALHMTSSWMQQEWGLNEVMFRLKKDILRCVAEDVDKEPLCVPHRLTPPDPVQMQFIALKAPLVIFILNKFLRKSGTSLGISKVLPRLFLNAITGDLGSQSSYNTLSTTSFLRMSRKACGSNAESLATFAEQWIYSSGCPTFEINAHFNRKKMAVELQVNQYCTAHLYASKAPYSERAHIRPVAEFTGQMTIRIHEADGTPYEHELNIQESQKRHEVPFNTKYKRVRRNTKRFQAKQAAAVLAATKEKNPLGADDAQQQPEDSSAPAPGASVALDTGDKDTPSQEAAAQDQNQESEDESGPPAPKVVDMGFGVGVWEDPLERQEWRVVDWTEEEEILIGQATYEWIRLDASYDWICAFHFNQQSFMWISQLTRDRDVIAQVEAIHALARLPSPIVACQLAKTVLIPAYSFRTRVEAALALLGCANGDTNYYGLFYLLKLYQTFFCFPPENYAKGLKIDTFKFRCIPLVNDYSDLAEYFIRRALLSAMSFVKLQGSGHTPKVVTQALLDALLYNDNNLNPYSDTFFLTQLLAAFAYIFTQSPAIRQEDDAESSTMEEQGPLDPNAKAVVDAFPTVLAEVDRLLASDRIVPSYRNIISVACIQFKLKLMLTSKLPADYAFFFTYTRDGNALPVRLAAFDALILLRPPSSSPLTSYIFSVILHDSSLLIRTRVAQSYLAVLPIWVHWGLVPTRLNDPETILPTGPNVDSVIHDIRHDFGRSHSLRRNLLNVLVSHEADPDVMWSVLKMCENMLRPNDEPEDPSRAISDFPARAASPPPPAAEAKLPKLKLSMSSKEPDEKVPEAQPETKASTKRASASTQDDEDLLKLVSIQKKLLNSKHATMFLTPVDPELNGAPDYFEIIKEPMDLSTMASKLSQGAYSSREGYRDDFKLMISNAIEFNITGPVVDEARALDTVFDATWAHKFPHDEIKTSTTDSDFLALIENEPPRPAPSLKIRLSSAADKDSSKPTSKDAAHEGLNDDADVEQSLEQLLEPPSSSRKQKHVASPESPDEGERETQQHTNGQENGQAISGDKDGGAIVASPEEEENNEPKEGVDYIWVEKPDALDEPAPPPPETFIPRERQISVKKCKQAIAKLMDMNESLFFRTPVVPEGPLATYYDEVPHPMDLTTILHKVDEGSYSNFGEFYDDVFQIRKNSEIFNGDTEPTWYAELMMRAFSREIQALSKMSAHERTGLQRLIKKALNDDQFYAFREPVDPVALNIPTYFDVIGGQQNARDLSLIRRKLDSRQYATIEDFEADIQLMVLNCIVFNGEESFLAPAARQLALLFGEGIDRIRDEGMNKLKRSSTGPSSARKRQKS